MRPPTPTAPPPRPARAPTGAAEGTPASDSIRAARWHVTLRPQVRGALAVLSLLLVVGCASPRVEDDVWGRLRPADIVAVGAAEARLVGDDLHLVVEASYDHGVPDQSLRAVAPLDEPELDPGEERPDEEGQAVLPLARDGVHNVWLRPSADASEDGSGDGSGDGDPDRDADAPDDEPPGESLPILSALHFLHVQDAIVEGLAPAEPGTARILRLGLQDEWLLGRDADGELVVALPEERPPGLRVRGTVPEEEVSRVIQEVLDTTLAELDVHARRVLMNTGFTDPTDYACVYVDLDEDRVYLLRLAAPGGLDDRSVERAGAAGRRVVVQGTVVEIATRPVSTVYRLLFAAKHGVTDLLKPTDSRRVLALSDEPPPVVGDDEPGMDVEAFEERLDSITSTERHEGTVDLLVDGDEYFPRFFEVVQDAEESVDVRMFIFKTDDYAVRVAHLLRLQADERDVDVKVLLDGVGTLMGVVDADPSFPAGFVPPLSIVDTLEDDSDVRVRVRTRAFLVADHTKTILVDGQRGFLGGMNIGREYRYEWHDLMAEVEGPIVTEMQRHHDDAWAHAGWAGDLGYLFHKIFGRSPPEAETPEGAFPIRVLRTRSDASEIYRAQLAAIQAAKKRIVIENAYFSDDEIVTELVAARLRGVDVRVILPVRGNHGIMNASNLVTTNVLLQHGIRVYLYPGMTHVKAAVYDGWACLGSANFDRLSLRRNQELNIAFSDPGAVAEVMAEVLGPDLEASLEVTEPVGTNWADHLKGFLAGAL